MKLTKLLMYSSIVLSVIPYSINNVYAENNNIQNSKNIVMEKQYNDFKAEKQVRSTITTIANEVKPQTDAEFDKLYNNAKNVAKSTSTSKYKWYIDENYTYHIGRGVFDSIDSSWKGTITTGNNKVKKVSFDQTLKGDIKLNNAFLMMEGLVQIDGMENLDTSQVTEMKQMFYGCKELVSVNVSKWDTSNLVVMDSIFALCQKLQVLDVSNWNTSKAGSMTSLFASCNSLSNLDVSKWNTSNVKSMAFMFEANYTMTKIDLSNWDTSSVLTMEAMFNYCTGLTSLNLTGKFNTSKVTSMKYMFSNNSKIKEHNLSNFNTSNVTDMSYMFNGNTLLEKLDLRHFNTSKVTSLQTMFGDDENLKELDVSTWDVSKVTNFKNTFNYIPLVEKLDLSNWKTTSATDMSYMFSYDYKLSSLDLSGFDTRNVTNLFQMFYDSSELSHIKFGENFIINKDANTNQFLEGTKSSSSISTGYWHWGDDINVRYSEKDFPLKLDVSKYSGDWYAEGTTPITIKSFSKLIDFGNVVIGSDSFLQNTSLIINTGSNENYNVTVDAIMNKGTLRLGYDGQPGTEVNGAISFDKNSKVNSDDTIPFTYQFIPGNNVEPGPVSGSVEYTVSPKLV